MNKAVFLDRDGVINEFLYEIDGNIMSPATIEQVRIMPKAKEGIDMMKKMGFKVIVVSNQPGVAFGYLREEKLKEIDNFLQEKLGIDAVYECTHHPKYDGDCDCRKPLPGLIIRAAKEFDIDVKESYMVGDNLSDIKTGQNAKVKKTFRIGTLREDIMELQHKKEIYPDYTLPDLVEVAKKIKEISA